MNARCSVPLLESALAGNLPKEEEAGLHRHLEECAACSAALEQMAGGPAWCQKAASLLTDDELDAAVPTRDQWSEVDFIVEHLEPGDEPNVLGRLGGYDVLEIIGHGGMGVVLKAFDRELKRCVAIKVLAPHLAQSSLARKRFAREAQAAAAVVHPHVLAIHQVQPNGRLPFLVMPLVAGESLAERLTAQGTLELKEILRIGMQAAAGLAAAHEQGLVHRDVKPANILLEKGVERAVLTDFGLARAADDVTLTRWGVIAGTPQYMSPEQARGEPLDGRSDLFSLGCVLYEMATGVSPFRTDSIMATMRRLVEDSPQAMASLNPELPPWFIAVVDRLLEKDPSRRFGSAKEVSELLEGCLAHVQQPSSVPLPAGLPKPVSRRAWRSNLSIKGVLAMIGTLGIGLLGIFLVSANPPDIVGQWSGEDWGTVVLKKTNDAEYTGYYSDTVGKQTGEIQLKWSRIERRFNGTWREGDDRFGELSLRLAGDEIRGALTTDAKSKINPATPRLADLTWSRATTGLLSRWMDGTLPPGGKEKAAFEKRRQEIDRIICTELWRQYFGDLVSKKDDTGKGSDEATDRLEFQRIWIQIMAAATLADVKAVVQGIKDKEMQRRVLDEIEKGIQTLRNKEQSTLGTPPAANHSSSGPDKIPTSPEKVAESPPKTASAMPQLLFQLQASDKVKIIACSADGKRIAIANGNPTFPLSHQWKRSVEILQIEAGHAAVIPLQLTTKDEDAVLAAAEGIHHFEVEALAFSPDGNVLAVGTGLGQVKLYNARTGELIFSLDDSRRGSLQAEFRRALIEAARQELGDEGAKGAEKMTEKLKSLERAMGSVASLAFSPDGTLLATCGSSFDDFARTWGDVERQGELSTGPGRLKVWEVKTGTLTHDLVGHSHANAVAFSPDGKLLASAGSWLSHDDHGTGVIFWNPRTGAELRTLTTLANGGTHSVAFSPDNRFVVISSRSFDKDNDSSASSISLTHIMSGINEWQQTFPGATQGAAFSPDGKSVAVLCGGQTVRFLETATGKVAHEIRAADTIPGGRWNNFAIAPQGHMLAIGAIDAQKRGIVMVWDLDGKTGAAEDAPQKHIDAVIEATSERQRPNGQLANGAVVYWQAFDRLPTRPTEDELELLYKADESPGPLPDDVKSWTDRHESALELMHRATTAKTCDWEMWTDGPGFFVPQMNSNRLPELGLVSRLRARLRFETGDVAGAMNDVADSFKMARDVTTPRMWLMLCFGASLENRITEVLAEHLPQLDRATLDELQKQLAALPATPPVYECLRFDERICCDWLESEFATQLALPDDTNVGDDVREGLRYVVLVSTTGLTEVEVMQGVAAVKTVGQLRKSLAKVRQDFQTVIQLAGFVSAHERLEALNRFEADSGRIQADHKTSQAETAGTPYAGKAASDAWLSLQLVPRVSVLVAQETKRDAYRELLRLAIQVERDGKASLPEADRRDGTLKYDATRTDFELRCRETQADPWVVLRVGPPEK